MPAHAARGADAASTGRGRFIVFEGIDGSGKSTALATVAAALRKEGHDIVETREETPHESGQWVKKAVAEKWDPLATSFLFLADRARHVAEIRAAVAEGKVVLCDRFLHSTLAYQSVTLEGRFPDPVAFLRHLHDGWCPQPDHVLLFRADPVRCLDRIRKRGQTTPYEQVLFLERVQEVYTRLAQTEPRRFRSIDAERDVVAVAAEATDLVRSWTQ